MNHNEFAVGETLALGNEFKIAVGDRVSVHALKDVIDACRDKQSVRLFTADQPYKAGSGDWNPMRVNIHLDDSRKVSRINFG